MMENNSVSPSVDTTTPVIKQQISTSKKCSLMILAAVIGVALMVGGVDLALRQRTSPSISGSSSNDNENTNTNNNNNNNGNNNNTILPTDPDVPSTDDPPELLTMAPSSNSTNTTNTEGEADSCDPTFSPTTSQPTSSPSVTPTQSPTSSPSVTPTQSPTLTPTNSPSNGPSIMPALYQPGELSSLQHGLLLSRGLRTRIIATSGEPVPYTGIIRAPKVGTTTTTTTNTTFPSLSSDPLVFHSRPDFGATFVDERPWNVGGWIYTSNSEMEQKNTGGVGSITFDKNGNVIDYRMVLEKTTMNCGGGRTPWNTWISCEEIESTGKIYQVDPTGIRPSQQLTLGSDGGRWESFAYDIRDLQHPRFFVTEDHNKGTVRRFTPSQSYDYYADDPWSMLHDGDGIVEYLMVHPNINNSSSNNSTNADSSSSTKSSSTSSATTGGTFEWITDRNTARNNARSYYPQSEGIDIYGSLMFVVCKNIKQLFTFDLDTGTYVNQTTTSGLFDGGPDQMKRIISDDTTTKSELLYFTEEGGKDAGIHARDQEGRFFTVLESPIYEDETTGLAFSPDAKHMYVAYQVNGLLFDVWRDDGLAFDAKTLNVKYHAESEGVSR